MTQTLYARMNKIKIFFKKETKQQKIKTELPPPKKTTKPKQTNEKS
jgi:hypothetical protein